MIASRDISEMLPLTKFRYSFLNVPYYVSPFTGEAPNYAVKYLFSGNNITVALTDIMYANDLWIQAATVCEELPIISFSERDIRFEPVMDNIGDAEYKSFSYFNCSPLRSSGKPNKFPLIIEFFVGKYLENYFINGTICYNSDGEIAKYDISLTCSWCFSDVPLISYAVSFVDNGMLMLKSIHKGFKSSNSTIYENDF